MFRQTGRIWKRSLFNSSNTQNEKSSSVLRILSQVKNHGRSFEAIKRGVQLTIIAPIQADHPFVKEASFPYFRQLLHAGAHIYQFYNGFYHTKVIVIDDDICDIGTANFDRRSLFINYEMNCYIYDKPFIQHVKQTIARDIDTSTLLTAEYFRKQSWLHRFKEAVATMLSPLL